MAFSMDDHTQTSASEPNELKIDTVEIRKALDSWEKDLQSLRHNMWAWKLPSSEAASLLVSLLVSSICQAYADYNDRQKGSKIDRQLPTLLKAVEVWAEEVECREQFTGAKFSTYCRWKELLATVSDYAVRRDIAKQAFQKVH